jgi:hypothetical protein
MNESVEVAKTILAVVKASVRGIVPYSATVAAVDSNENFVTIKRPEETTAGSQRVTHLAGTFRPKVGDRVLCLNLGDTPIIVGRMKKADDSPPTVAVQTAVGTGGTASIGAGSSDFCGVLQFQTGSAAVTTGSAGVVTFATPFTNGNYAVQISPASLSAGDINYSIASKNSTAWTFTFRTAPGTGQTLNFNYSIIPYQS